MAERRHKIMIAKAGLDGHDRGAKVIARALRDAGMDVLYTGLHQTPASIVRAAIDEDVDAVGLSSLSGAHMRLFQDIIEQFAAEKVDSVVLFGGGVIPETDRAALLKLGVAEIFQPGTSTGDIVSWIRTAVPMKR